MTIIYWQIRNYQRVRKDCAPRCKNTGIIRCETDTADLSHHNSSYRELINVRLESTATSPTLLHCVQSKHYVSLSHVATIFYMKLAVRRLSRSRPYVQFLPRINSKKWMNDRIPSVHRNRAQRKVDLQCLDRNSSPRSQCSRGLRLLSLSQS
jgi:hypothetical protein